MSKGEAVDPQSFTLVEGRENEFEVESIVDYTPKNAHESGKLRKVNELIDWAKWRGVAYGTHVRQPYHNIKMHAQDALRNLAARSTCLLTSSRKVATECLCLLMIMQQFNLTCSCIDQTSVCAEDLIVF